MANGLIPKHTVALIYPLPDYKRDLKQNNENNAGEEEQLTKPLIVASDGDACQRGQHNSIGRRPKEVGVAVTKVECQRCRLEIHADALCNGSDDRHSDTRLTGTGGDDEVEEGLEDEHQDDGNVDIRLAKQPDHGVDHRILDAAGGHDIAHTVSKANDHCRKSSLTHTIEPVTDRIAGQINLLHFFACFGILNQRDKPANRHDNEHEREE